VQLCLSCTYSVSDRLTVVVTCLVCLILLVSEVLCVVETILLVSHEPTVHLLQYNMSMDSSFFIEGPRSRCYRRTAALRLIVQPCDEVD
jgi:hypothetical protein